MQSHTSTGPASGYTLVRKPYGEMNRSELLGRIEELEDLVKGTCRSLLHKDKNDLALTLLRLYQYGATPLARGWADYILEERFRNSVHEFIAEDKAERKEMML